MVTLGWVTDQIKMQWARVKISVVIGFSSVPRRGSRCLIERRPVLYPVVFVGDTCHHIEELVHTSRCYQITIQSKHSIPIAHLAGGVDEYLQFLQYLTLATSPSMFRDVFLIYLQIWQLLKPWPRPKWCLCSFCPNLITFNLISTFCARQKLSKAAHLRSNA